MTYALVIHGGGGAQPSIDYTQQRAHLGDLAARGGAMLKAGEAALDVVTAMVAELEESGLYVAGKGSAPNTDGVFELDASIMEGGSRRAGAVSALTGIKHPIQAARNVMENSNHVLLTGEGARLFALAGGLEVVTNPETYYSEHQKHGSGEVNSGHGTVGAVALDQSGALAAATSTGGTFHKRPGRVGDTPLIGAGTWADDLVATSCTGLGEAFIRSCAAHDVAARMRYGGASLQDAGQAVLDEVARCEGTGGIIGVDRDGRIFMDFNSDGMKRAAVSDTMEVTVRVFEPE